NQVDSHRERLGLDPTVPGLLIINDFMDVEDFEERRAKPFAETHLEHAKSNNIRVLRTTSLFDIMRRCEDVAQRADIILSLCSSANPLVTLSDSRSS
ncbi:MAG TPA: hypothetical protein VD994_14740, partial [Prosthecobacter sp.]|nr:hypothetical protein [Prosthecobacter sp.]